MPARRSVSGSNHRCRPACELASGRSCRTPVDLISRPIIPVPHPHPHPHPQRSLGSHLAPKRVAQVAAEHRKQRLLARQQRTAVRHAQRHLVDRCSIGASLLELLVLTVVTRRDVAGRRMARRHRFAPGLPVPDLMTQPLLFLDKPGFPAAKATRRRVDSSCLLAIFPYEECEWLISDRPR